MGTTTKPRGKKPAPAARKRTRTTTKTAPVRRKSGKTRTVEVVLEELAQVRDAILVNEEQEAELRKQRNTLVLEARAFPHPPTLEQVAAVAGMVPSYVSRVQRANGNPASGSHATAKGGKD